MPSWRSSGRIRRHSAFAAFGKPAGISGSPAGAAGSCSFSRRLPGFPRSFLTAVGSGRRPDPLGMRWFRFAVEDRLQPRIHIVRAFSATNEIEARRFLELDEFVIVAGHAPIDFVGRVFEKLLDPVFGEDAAAAGENDPPLAHRIPGGEDFDRDAPDELARFGTGHFQKKKVCRPIWAVTA